MPVRIGGHSLDSIAKGVHMTGGSGGSGKTSTAPFFDDFYGVGNLTMQGRSPLVRPVTSSATWSIVTGVAVLTSGHLEMQFPSVNQAILSLDHGGDETEIRAEFEFPSAGGTSRSASVALRVLDANNYWIAQAQLDGGTVRIIQNASGFTNRATGTFTWLVDTRYAIRFKVVGSLFTATFYQVIGGVDTLITPATGTNPQTYDATALGAAAGTGRNLHGIRAGHTVGGAPIRFYEFESWPTPTVTFAGSSFMTSNFRTAVSHVASSDLLTGNATAKARAEASLATAFTFHRVSACDSFGTTGPWVWDGTGSPPADPTSWTSLDNLVNMVITDMGGTPIIGWGNWPWWLKGLWDGTTTTPMTLADQFNDDGRPYTANISDILHLVDKTVLRYAAPPFGVRYWQPGQYEFHGFSRARDGTFNNVWGYDAYAGSVGQADMGMAYLHNQVSAQIIASNTALGITRGNYKICAPYVPTPSYGGFNGQAEPAGHPLNGKIWGTSDKREISSLLAFLPLLTSGSWDIWSFDINSLNKDGIVLTDDWSVQAKLTDVTNYLTTQVAGLGYGSKSCWISEFYPKPVTDPGASSQQYRAAIMADGMCRVIKEGVQMAILWSTSGRANDPPANNTDAALVTSVATAPGGVTQPTFDVQKMIHDHFESGTALYAITSTNANIDGIASLTHALLFNRSASTVSVNVAGVSYSFASHEVKLVVR